MAAFQSKEETNSPLRLADFQPHLSLLFHFFSGSVQRVYVLKVWTSYYEKQQPKFVISYES